MTFISHEIVSPSRLRPHGIDIIAFNPRTKERLGITVKSRTRKVLKETDSVNVFRRSRKRNDRQKVMEGIENRRIN